VAPLAEHLGVVDEVVAVAALEPLPRRLARPELAVNLHGRGPESTRRLAELDPELLIAFRGAGFENGPPWLDDEHEVARWCRLLEFHGIATDPSALAIEPPGVPPPVEAEEATLVHAGASSPARRWPEERWAAVARAEAHAGHPVLVTGAPDEADLARRVAVAAGLPPEAVLAGRTSLLELAALGAASGRVACGDTGVSHLATALGTPSVTLFGPTPPSEWGPPPSPRHLALWAGRKGEPRGHELDPALAAISVDDVVSALRCLPDRSARNDVRMGADETRPASVGRRDSGNQLRG
jgi:hypothetical protein